MIFENICIIVKTSLGTRFTSLEIHFCVNSNVCPLHLLLLSIVFNGKHWDCQSFCIPSNTDIKKNPEDLDFTGTSCDNLLRSYRSRMCRSLEQKTKRNAFLSVKHMRLNPPSEPRLSHQELWNHSGPPGRGARARRPTYTVDFGTA